VSHLLSCGSARLSEATDVFGSAASLPRRASNFSVPGLPSCDQQARHWAGWALHATAARNLSRSGPGMTASRFTASHSSIFEHFWSPYFNQRETSTAVFSLENRAVLLV